MAGVITRVRTGGRHARWAALLGLAAMCAPDASSAEPRAVVELFTSQGCSSCPPADRLMGDLAQDPSVIVLSFPIDYWDYLGWKDTLAQPKFAARQRGYAYKRGDREVYTPQAVVNGVSHALGSDGAQISKTILATREKASVMALPVSLSLSGSQATIGVPAAASSERPAKAEVWICGVSREIHVNIGRGENRGREVGYHNVVRRWLKVGDWTGRAGNWSVPLENITGDDIDLAVVYVQEGTREKPGAMLGAVQAPLKPVTASQP